MHCYHQFVEQLKVALIIIYGLVYHLFPQSYNRVTLKSKHVMCIIGYDMDDAYFTNGNATAEITGWCNAQMTWLSNHARGIKICM